MIDFRYHLISLVGVILALALGILAGSGFLGGPFLERLERDVHRAEERNSELQERIREQDALLAQNEAFARASGPLLIRGELAGEDVVVFELEGTADGLGEQTRRGLLEAGADITWEITFTTKLAMSSAPAVDELSLITGSLGSNADELLETTATLIGSRASAAADDGSPPVSSSASQRFETLIVDLQEAGFLSVTASEEGPSVPRGASFVVVGGSSDRPPFETGTFVTALAAALAERDTATMVVEPSTSIWELVSSVRRDIEARSEVATVDNGETTLGQIAVVLGLDEAIEGTVGHFGITPGSAIIPAAVPSG